jgi:hypothetical protein
MTLSAVSAASMLMVGAGFKSAAAGYGQEAHLEQASWQVSTPSRNNGWQYIPARKQAGEERILGE